MTDTFSEHDFLAGLRELKSDPRLLIPIGDDAALLADGGSGILLASDSVVEGTHCEAGGGAAEILARKAVRSNLSDIAAMGGRPESVLLNLVLPHDRAASAAETIVRVAAEECERFGVALAGGDTVCAGDLIVVSVSVTGRLIADAVTRSGASVGDLIVVSGDLGGSSMGHHDSFIPRLDEAARLVELGVPTAMADISDGLLRDLANICAASGCGARIDASQVPISGAAEFLSETPGEVDSLHRALHDGEDFELLFTISPESSESLEANWNIETKLTVIGEMVESGLWLEQDGSVQEVEPGGYDHGAGRKETDND